jgi:hypothetical protein
MSIPGLFFGQAEGGAVLACGQGYTDAGDTYTARIRSGLAAPEDGEERIWPAVLVMLNHRVEADDAEPSPDEYDVTVRAVVDEEIVATGTISLSLEPIADPDDPPARVRRTYEVAFSIPRMRGLVEVGKNVPAGTNFQLELEWPGSDVAVDAACVEWEPTGETRVAG